MKFCPVVPEICRGQVHASRKERIIIIIIKIKIIIRNVVGRLNKGSNTGKRARRKNLRHPSSIYNMFIKYIVFLL